MKSISKLMKQKGGIRLDIGGGANPQPGFVNIDYRPLPEVDIVHDLEKTPWPLPDKSVIVAVSSHVIEHINPHAGVFINFMNEAWRVLKYDAEYGIVVPYAGSHGYFQDPTHCNPCNESTWEYFDPLAPHAGWELYRIYEPAPWKIKPNSLSLSKTGNMEVVLIKRRDDKAYHADRKIHWQ